MDKGQEEVKSLNGFRFGLLLAYVVVSAWTLVIAVEGHGGSIVLVPLILGVLAFIAGYTLRREGIVSLGWVGLGVSFAATQFSLSNITYLSAIASVMLMLVLIDFADFLRLMGVSASHNTASSRDQYTQTWSLAKRHSLLTLLVAGLSTLISLIVLLLSVPIEFGSNPVFALALLAPAALLLTASALVTRPVPQSSRLRRDSRSIKRRSKCIMLALAASVVSLI
jgi:hypothetical protein